MNFKNIADFKDPDDTQERTYREVNNSKTHKFKVGDLVEYEGGVRLFIAKQTRDCDETPLYCLTPVKDDYDQKREGSANSNWINGVCEESLTGIEYYECATCGDIKKKVELNEKI